MKTPATQISSIDMPIRDHSQFAPKEQQASAKPDPDQMAKNRLFYELELGRQQEGTQSE